MESNKRACLQERMAINEQERLSEILQSELQKENCEIDDDLVRQILDELESREDDPKYQDNAEAEKACGTYRAGCVKMIRTRKPVRRWSIRVAAIAAVISILIVVVPAAQGAGNFLEFVSQIRDDVVAFFNPDQTDNRLEYEYHTEHPGLQQLYDAVVELGVTEDVVPMWIPEEYELVGIEKEVGPAKTRICGWFKSEDKTIIVTFELYGMAVTHEYLKGDAPVDIYERAGIVHEIYLNHEKYLVLWERENMKNSIVVDCQEDQLIEVLKSIYRWRMNN